MENIEFKTLTSDQVIGPNKLEIFNNISAAAKIDDVAIFSIGESIYDKENYPYWIDKFEVKEKPCGPKWRTPEPTKKEYFAYYQISNNLSVAPYDDVNIGTRLVIPYDDIKDKVILNAIGDIVSYEERGVKVLKALLWPQRFLDEDSKTKKNLDMMFDVKCLSFTGYVPLKRYGNVDDYCVYSYKNEKYVKIGDSWSKMEPIEWYYDEKSGLLVSKNVLFVGLCMYKDKKDFASNFSETTQFSYINKLFSNCTLLQEYDIDFFCFPFSVDDNSTEINNLEELNKWTEYIKKREERRMKLIEYKGKLLDPNISLKEKNEIAEYIEELLILNEEDENLVKKANPILEKIKY